jgi:glycerophosphoryl diester phosphodiesterase
MPFRCRGRAFGSARARHWNRARRPAFAPAPACFLQSARGRRGEAATQVASPRRAGHNMRIGLKTKRAARLALGVVLGVVVAAAALYVALALSRGRPVADHAFFGGDALLLRPLVIAHRGGAGLWPENTLHAFESARAAGADIIEMDVRSTSDGVLVIHHDETVERTTDGRGRVQELTLAELKRLDAAHRWTPDGGRTFPMRGAGLTVPTLEEVFARLTGARFVIEIKQDEPPLAAPLCAALRGHDAGGRVLVASFHQSTLDDFRRACPEVATSAAFSEGYQFLARFKAGLGDSYSPAMQALQTPERLRGWQVLTRDFVESAHGLNLRVHAWTINDTEDMRRLIDIGVDGIITDYPDRLSALRDQLPPR